MFGITLDPALARRAALDALILFVVLVLISTLGLHRDLQLVPALAVTAGTFCYRYVFLRRQRDKRAVR
jgi:hypothetical protein